jgi:hypothetical protein
MPHYIISNRRAQRFGASAQKASRSFMETTFNRTLRMNASIIAEPSPLHETSRRIIHFEAESEEVRAKSIEFSSDILLEPAIPHFPAWSWPLNIRLLSAPGGATATAGDPWTWPLAKSSAPWAMPPGTATPAWTWPLQNLPPIRGATSLANVLAGTGQQFRLRVLAGGLPVLLVQVTLIVRAPGGVTLPLKAMSDPGGHVTFNFGSNVQPLLAVAEPHGDFWPIIKRGPLDNEVLELTPLPKQGPIGWWHDVCGVSTLDPLRGQGIKIGVIDTGAGPHPALNQISALGSIINGTWDQFGGGDVDRHGSHVCGTIGASTGPSGEYLGVASGAKVFSIRVFPDPAGLANPEDFGANQGDIADAIDRLSQDHQVDVINMSLGSGSPSQIEQDAIQDALERGTLCVCAAGNDGSSPVSYPARFPQTVAVSALGLNGWGPFGSATAANYPNSPDRYGDESLFLAEFSNFGPEILCAAPGNGIIAPVPAKPPHFPAPFAALDGTSMASPIATGLLAAALARDPAYQVMPRNLLRAQRARQILEQICVPIGLAAQYQGRGLVRLP